VPRWRPSDRLQDSPEARPLRPRNDRVTVAHWFDTAYADWLQLKSMGALADAFSAAIVEDRSKEASMLAREIMRQRGQATPTLQKLAEAVLDKGRPEGGAGGARPDLKRIEVVRQAIAFFKKKTAIQPRNAFVWHDLSYNYLMLGEAEKAERAMATALAVSGHHRLITRSASRLYIHVRQPEKALSTLTLSRGFIGDPWLLSAHVAISQGSDKSSKFLKQASALFETQPGRIESSELGMALATEAFLNGRAKVAKKLAKSALIDPTENSLAQGVWISRKLNIDSMVADVSATKDAYEAQAFDAYYRGEWKSSLESALAWLRDQPFSSRPALLATFMAATFLRDFALSEEIARFSLRTNTDDWMLTNNLIVALAEQDKLQEATELFTNLRVPGTKNREYATWLATGGLIRFRSGDAEGGRALYGQSIEKSQESGDRTSELVGALYQSLEEARIGETERAAKLLMDVRDHGSLDSRRSKDESAALDVLNNEIHSLTVRRRS